MHSLIDGLNRGCKLTCKLTLINLVANLTMAAGQRGGAMSKGGRGGAGRGGASRGGAGRGGRGGSRGGRGGQKGRNGNNERKAPPLPVITDEDEDDMPVDEDDIEFLREYGAHAKFLESMDADTLLKCA